MVPVSSCSSLERLHTLYCTGVCLCHRRARVVKPFLASIYNELVVFGNVHSLGGRMFYMRMGRKAVRVERS